MKLSVEVDEAMLKEVNRSLGDLNKKAPAAIARAINRAATNINSNISKQVRKEYVIKASDVKGTLKKTKASSGKLSAEVRSSGNLIGLDKFKVSPNTPSPRRRKPIRVSVKKGSMKQILSAFVASQNGIKVFERKANSKHVKRDGRWTELPLRRLYGPSVPQMINNPSIKDEIESEGQATFNKRLDHEVNRILEKGRG